MTKADTGSKRVRGALSPLQIGDVHNRLTAVRELGLRSKKRFWLFRCECGSDYEADSAAVRRGRNKSCGCYRSEFMRARQLTHGGVRTPEYHSWQAMLERCRNPKNVAYASYGGRGIRVCSRWKSFANFKADMGPRPDGMSLDRIEADGDYEPGNCRWADALIQANNKVNTIVVQHCGWDMPLVIACRAEGLIYATVYGRLRRGIPAQQAFDEALIARGLMPVAPVGQNA